MRRLIFLAVMAMLCCTTPALLEAADTSDESPDRECALEGLAWMAGYWTGVHGGVRMEECWLSPGGGLMLGLHRDVFPSGKSFFEYLRIEKTPEAVIYFASPRGGAVTPFQLVHCGKEKAVFENRDHDFPQRIAYWIDEKGLLHARIEGKQNGKERFEEWVWHPTPVTNKSGSESQREVREKQ